MNRADLFKVRISKQMRENSAERVRCEMERVLSGTQCGHRFMTIDGMEQVTFKNLKR